MSTAAKQIAAMKTFNTQKQQSASMLEAEVYSWSKEKLILKMYDLFIISVKRNDISKGSKVLIELMSALNFDYEEVSTRLYRLYEYCQRCIFQKKIDEALFIITELRNTWAITFNLEENKIDISATKQE
ncbi:MAG: flagellar protein FliS [Bacteroidetes bacterium]|nr:flagellar protein FliS [Bacteroidota bacterium]